MSYVAVQGGSSSAGGLVGNVSSNSLVKNCFHDGTVGGNGGYGGNGGIVGINYGKITNCYHIGEVSATSRNASAGGIVGLIDSGKSSEIINCYSSGSISGSGFIGGAIGRNMQSTSIVSNVYYDSTLFTGGDSCSGVEGKSTEQFASGEVAWLLNNGVTDGTQVYYQTCGIGTPAFSGQTVYAVYDQQCPGMEPSGDVQYSNTPGTVGAHNYIEVIEEKYLKSAANCHSPAVYYKSCSYCKNPSETETFENGDIDPDNHTGSIQWENDAYTHRGTYSCCQLVETSEEKHTWENGVCTTCGYVCQHTGGTPTCTQRAVCEICGAEYGEAYLSHETVKVSAKEPTVTEDGNIEYWKCEKCGKYFSDRFGITEISPEDTILHQIESNQDTSVLVGGSSVAFTGTGTWTDPYFCEFPYRSSKTDSLTIETVNSYAVIADSNGEEKGNAMTAALNYGWNEILFTVMSSDETETKYYKVRWQRTKLQRDEDLTYMDVQCIPATDEATSDGKITGLNPEEVYLYRMESESQWNEIQGAEEITGLKTGPYHIRYGESAVYQAQSQEADVYIGTKDHTMQITNMTSEKIEVASSVSEGERVDFRIKLV